MSDLLLNNELDQWNRQARAQPDVFRQVRQQAEDHLFRLLMSILDPRTFVVAAFIYDRTFRWGKYAEAIPHAHFLEGFTAENDRDLRVNDSGRVLCAGIGDAFSNSKATLVGHLNKLLEQTCVESLPALRRIGRPVSSYIFNRRLLGDWIVEANGSLPLGAQFRYLAPALLDGEPVRILDNRTVPMTDAEWAELERTRPPRTIRDGNEEDDDSVDELDGDEEDMRPGKAEFEVLRGTHETLWVSWDALDGIPPEDWSELKKANRWLQRLPEQEPI